MKLTTIDDVCSRPVQAFHWRNVGSVFAYRSNFHAPKCKFGSTSVLLACVFVFSLLQMLKLKVPSGLRAERPCAAGDGRRWAGRAGGGVRGLRVGADGGQGRAAVLDRGAQADRPVVGAGAEVGCGRRAGPPSSDG